MTARHATARHFRPCGAHQGWRLILLGACLWAHAAHAADPAVQELDLQFARQVDHRLILPLSDQRPYVSLAQQALAQAGLSDLPAQTVLLIDRSPLVQAAFLLLLTDSGEWHWIGATAVSTGKPGGFKHFVTPLGVFLHSPDNPDYRAAGTYNKNHVRGYGVRGMRVFDFGWQMAERGWGSGAIGPMRLAMHATDPQRLEARLGSIASDGCIRIPASLNHFLDHYGVLDAAYEAALSQGKALRVLLPDRQPLAWPGRYLVVVDSAALNRPFWSPEPGKQNALTTSSPPGESRVHQRTERQKAVPHTAGVERGEQNGPAQHRAPGPRLRLVSHPLFTGTAP